MLRRPSSRATGRPARPLRVRGACASIWSRVAFGIALVAASGCEFAYPEVVVTNDTAETVQIRNISFSGCAWDGVLAFGDSSSPGRCLPGEDRVHFEKLDVAAYCREQAEDGTLDGVCPCGTNEGDVETMEELTNAEPMWFSYQTASPKHVEYGDFRIFEIRLSDMEQDFSVPGPYGH
jgi:hypothetical protein